MKKIAFTLSLALAISVAYGQDTAAVKIRRHVISVYYCYGSYGHFKSRWRLSYEPTIISGQYGYKAVGYNNLSHIGMYGIGYSYMPLNKLEVGITANYEQLHNKWMLYHSPQGSNSVTERNHYLYIMPSIALLYINKSVVDLYSSFEVGAVYQWNTIDELHDYVESKSKFDAAIQAWVIGVRVKYKAMGMFCNLGVGYQGLCRAGLSFQL